MPHTTKLTGGSGFRLTPTGRRKIHPPIQERSVSPLAPLCPVIELKAFREARAQRLSRGVRPGGSAA